MREATQFTVFLENKPGRLLHVCAALVKEKVNIEALTVMDSKEHSVFRFVPDDAPKARTALRRIGMEAMEAGVVIVELKSQSGALANLCEQLAAEHVNIDYLYSSTGNKNGRATAVLKATPLEKVKSALATPTKPKVRPTLRRPSRFR